MSDYQVIMNIDIDKDKEDNLFIVSSSFDYARKIAGEILVEDRKIETMEVKIFQVEGEQIAYCYSGSGVKN